MFFSHLTDVDWLFFVAECGSVDVSKQAYKRLAVERNVKILRIYELLKVSLKGFIPLSLIIYLPLCICQPPLDLFLLFDQLTLLDIKWPAFVGRSRLNAIYLGLDIIFRLEESLFLSGIVSSRLCLLYWAFSKWEWWRSQFLLSNWKEQNFIKSSSDLIFTVTMRNLDNSDDSWCFMLSFLLIMIDIFLRSDWQL